MQNFYSLKITINKAQNLNRLDQALANLSSFSRSQIKILITNEKISNNKEKLKNASQKVKTGEIYYLSLPIIKEEKFEAEKIPLKIVYEDNDIIVIDKNAGMVIHPAPGNYSGTLVNALLNYSKNNLSNINEDNRPGIVHRLDKETSGLLVVAKNNKSHINLAEQFKEHTILRKYHAIVWGKPQNQIIEGFIQRHKINRKKMSLNQQNKGKFSKTKISLIKYYEIASLIECKLETGRTHQVRLHMTSVNCPLIGDKVYGKSKVNQFGKDEKTFNKFLILKNFSRHALHAHYLAFNHPIAGKLMEFKSELPKDMKDLLDLLIKY